MPSDLLSSPDLAPFSLLLARLLPCRHRFLFLPEPNRIGDIYYGTAAGGSLRSTGASAAVLDSPFSTESQSRSSNVCAPRFFAPFLLIRKCEISEAG